VFLSLLPSASEQQLARLARGFKTDRDREMRVAILQALAARLEERGDVENLALQRQTIGDDLLKLGKAADAVPYLQKAMEYFEKQGAGGVVTETLIGQLLDAHLMAKQYAEAAAFGAHTLSRDPSQQGTVGPKLKQEADRLQAAGRSDDAIALIDAALAMNPPLVPRYTAQLREIREQAARQKANGAAAAPQQQR
jgi:tetratricopeptide (TPR) repeat protein